jgi:hypothetical protein
MRRLRRRLKNYDIQVTSRWLDEHTCPKGTPFDAFMQEMAEIDLYDILAADVFVRFTDDDVHVGKLTKKVPASLATGSRHFECGYAFRHGKQIIVVGGYQNVFDYLPTIEHVKNVDELITYLKEQS